MSEEIPRINPETGQPYPSQKEKLNEITAQIEQGIKDVYRAILYTHSTPKVLRNGCIFAKFVSNQKTK